MHVVAAQPGLDMSARDSAIKRAQGDDHDGRGVALDEDHGRTLPFQDLVDRPKEIGGKLCQALIPNHQVEVDIRGQPEIAKGLSEHLPVLSRGDEQCPEPLPPLAQGEYHRGHLHGLRPCPHKNQYGLFHAVSSTLVIGACHAGAVGNLVAGKQKTTWRADVQATLAVNDESPP